MILFNIVLIIIITTYLISISSKIFFKKKDNFIEHLSANSEGQRSNSNKIKQFIKIISYIGVFILNWILFKILFGIIGVIYASINMISVYFIARIFNHFKKPKHERERCNIIKTIKAQWKIKYIIYIIISMFYFIVLYMIFSFYYPFGFIWPANITLHSLLALFAFPIFLSIEILLRKVIYPLLNYTNLEASKNKIIIISAIVLIVSLSALTPQLSGFPSGVFAHFIFLIVIILNTKMFETIKSFYPIVVISFSIIQIFLATLISNAIGVNMLL